MVPSKYNQISNRIKYKYEYELLLEEPYGIIYWEVEFIVTNNTSSSTFLLYDALEKSFPATEMLSLEEIYES